MFLHSFDLLYQLPSIFNLNTFNLYSMDSTDCIGAMQCVSTRNILPPIDLEPGLIQEA